MKSRGIFILMNLPQLFLTLSQVPWLNEISLLVLSVVLGLVIAISNRWIVSLISLWVLFFCVGLLISNFVFPHIAFVIWIVGLFAGLIIYLSERGKPQAASLGGFDPMTFLLQLMLGLVFVLVCWMLQFIGLFDIFEIVEQSPTYVGFIASSLFLLGGLRFLTSNQSIFSGFGLLLILAGLLLVVPVLLPGKWVIGLWSGVTICLTLVFSYFSLLELNSNP